MTKENFERLNVLSEKAINEIVPTNELEEFNQLLNLWSESTEYNILQGFHLSNSQN